ncbi:MAG: M48 family metallopeptidase [Pseudomonadales bacterium]|nr:M48 family metallopeptidase [Pseudomonadales bacterium]
MSASLKYLSGYSESVQQQVQTLIDDDKLAAYINKKYPEQHTIRSDKALRVFVMDLKNRYLKKSAPLSQIAYDHHLHVVHNALGIHTRRSQIQGGKLKRKLELKVSSQFKKAPIAFLEMIVVHELAHLKELEHNKSFYALCEHMLPDYHQRELDMRLYLTHIELSR